MIALEITVAVITVVGIWASSWHIKRRWTQQVESLERDLQEVSEAMTHMAEVHKKNYQELLGNIGDLEERLMDLSVPSQDVSLPLGKKHRVLSLSRQGIGAIEIAKRLGVPEGETEFIVGLHKCFNPAAARASRATNGVAHYAQS
jgi:hypothetical protein